MVRRGVRIDDVGFTAKRATTGCELAATAHTEPVPADTLLPAYDLCPLHPAKALTVDEAALLAFDQRRAQGLQPGLAIFEQSQSCPNHFACRAIATIDDLGFDEILEVVAQGHGGVFACHGSVVPKTGTALNLALSSPTR